MAANAERDVDREQVQGNPSVQEKGGGIGARIVEAEELWRTRPVALWREMPLWKAAPKSLVGRRVAIYWGEDEAFYEGYVEGLCGESGPSHKVIYADGTAEHVLFAAERARMLMYPGEVLPPADAAESSAAAEALGQTPPRAVLSSMPLSLRLHPL